MPNAGSRQGRLRFCFYPKLSHAAWRFMLLGAFLVVSVAPARAEPVNIQVVNADMQSSVRVMLDHKVVFEGSPQTPPTDSHNGPLPIQVGSFELDGHAHHTLSAEETTTHTKAQFEWMPRHNPTEWVVVRYYPGRGTDAEPPFFTFALQPAATKLK